MWLSTLSQFLTLGLRATPESEKQAHAAVSCKSGTAIFGKRSTAQVGASSRFTESLGISSVTTRIIDGFWLRLADPSACGITQLFFRCRQELRLKPRHRAKVLCCNFGEVSFGRRGEAVRTEMKCEAEVSVKGL